MDGRAALWGRDRTVPLAVPAILLVLVLPAWETAVKRLVLNAPFFPSFSFLFLHPVVCCTSLVPFSLPPPIYGYTLEYSLGENEVCWNQLLSAALDTTCTVLRLYPGCVDMATCRPGGTPQGVPGE